MELQAPLVLKEPADLKDLSDLTSPQELRELLELVEAQAALGPAGAQELPGLPEAAVYLEASIRRPQLLLSRFRLLILP